MKKASEEKKPETQATPEQVARVPIPDVEALARRWEKARQVMQNAEGTAKYIQYALEHDIAGLQYQIAVRDKQLDHLVGRIQTIAKCYSDTIQHVQRLEMYMHGLPDRLGRLEGAYAHLSMVAHGHSFVEKILESYNMGLKAQAPASEGK